MGEENTKTLLSPPVDLIFPKMKRIFFLVIIFISILFGSSYQVFHHFNPNDTCGLSDTESYLEMANGNYNVNEVHKYRFIIPATVYGIKKVLGLNSSYNSALFYALNFFITIASSILIYVFLIRNGTTGAGAMLGGVLFLTNRVVVSSQLPLVDSLFFFGNILIIYLISMERYRCLTYMLPILILFKENLLPVSLLLFLRKSFLIRKKEIILFIFFFLFALIIYSYVREYIDKFSPTVVSHHKSIIDIIFVHLGFLKSHIQHLFSVRGINDILSAFGLLYIFVFFAIIEMKKGRLKIDMYLWALLPISFFYAILSGNLGRMLFTAYPLVYLLIVKFLERIYNFGHICSR